MKKVRRYGICSITTSKEVIEMLNKFKALIRDESGQDMIEYALLSSLIAVFLITVLVALGPILEDVFEKIIDALS